MSFFLLFQMGSTEFDINARAKSDYTALHFAADNGSAPVVKKLIKAKGIDVNVIGGVVR